MYSEQLKVSLIQNFVSFLLVWDLRIDGIILDYNFFNQVAYFKLQKLVLL